MLRLLITSSSSFSPSSSLPKLRFVQNLLSRLYFLFLFGQFCLKIDHDDFARAATLPTWPFGRLLCHHCFFSSGAIESGGPETKETLLTRRRCPIESPPLFVVPPKWKKCHRENNRRGSSKEALRSSVSHSLVLSPSEG